MAKSAGNFITLQTLQGKGIEPLSYRYFLLQSHYRKQTNFSWEALEAAQAGLKNLRKHVNKLKKNDPTDPMIEEKFFDALNDDLNTPEALAILWDALKKDEINLDTIIRFDKILALDLHQPEKAIEITDEIQKILDDREKARKAKDWVESDLLRDELRKMGFEVEDTGDGQVVVRSS